MVSGGKPGGVSIFGLFDVPYLPVSKATGQLGHSVHGVLGWVMLALVVLHIAAALRHHLLVRDTVLTRIAPVLDRR
jgi:cytochrome b561